MNPVSWFSMSKKNGISSLKGSKHNSLPHTVPIFQYSLELDFARLIPTGRGDGKHDDPVCKDSLSVHPVGCQGCGLDESEDFVIRSSFVGGPVVGMRTFHGS